MQTADLPRWLFDNTATPNESDVAHIQSPRFVARVHYEQESPVKQSIDGGAGQPSKD